MLDEPAASVQRPKVPGKFLAAGAGALAALGFAYFLSQSFVGGSGDDAGVFLSMEASSSSDLGFKLVNQSGSELYSLSVNKSKLQNLNEATLFVPEMRNNFTEGLTWGMEFRTKGGKTMIIDRYGRKTMDPPGVPLADFSEGLAAAHPRPSTNQLCGYLDREHKMRVPAEYDECAPFSGGLAMVRKGAQYGYVNQQGQLQIPAVYGLACKFSERLAVVRAGATWQVIDEQGKVQFPLQIGACTEVSNGLISSFEGNSVGFLDRSGKFAIPAKYRRASRFKEGRAYADTDGKWTLIDTTGRQLSAPEFTEAAEFDHGLASVRVGGKWGLMDLAGRLVGEAKYDEIKPLVSGLRIATRRGAERVEFLDERGAEVKAPAPVCVNYAHGVFTCLRLKDAKPLQSWAGMFGMATGQVPIDYITRSGSRIGGMDMSRMLGR